jgi:hypothetical protein
MSKKSDDRDIFEKALDDPQLRGGVLGAVGLPALMMAGVRIGRLGRKLSKKNRAELNQYMRPHYAAGSAIGGFVGSGIGSDTKDQRKRRK